MLRFIIELSVELSTLYLLFMDFEWGWTYVDSNRFHRFHVAYKTMSNRLKDLQFAGDIMQNWDTFYTMEHKMELQ